MDMKINSDLIVQLRKQRAWSQQHLSDVCGLSLRTIQRVENNGSGSFDTLQSLAASFDVRADSLMVKEQPDGEDQAKKTEPACQSLDRKSRTFNFKKAISSTAVLLSLLGGIVLTSSSSAAFGITINANTIVTSEDRTTDTFIGKVQILIPENIAFTILSGNRLNPAESSSNITVQTDIGTLVIADAEITSVPEGLSISANKAVWKHTSKS